MIPQSIRNTGTSGVMNAELATDELTSNGKKVPKSAKHQSARRMEIKLAGRRMINSASTNPSESMSSTLPSRSVLPLDGSNRQTKYMYRPPTSSRSQAS